MFEKLELTRMAQAMASNAGTRMGVIAENIANADTPGFKARRAESFAETYRETRGPGMRATRPGHIGNSNSAPRPRIVEDGGSGAPNGNTVSLEQEMVMAAEVRQDHEMALAIYRNSSEIIRASLGRSR